MAATPMSTNVLARRLAYRRLSRGSISHKKHLCKTKTFHVLSQNLFLLGRLCSFDFLYERFWRIR